IGLCGGPKEPKNVRMSPGQWECVKGAVRGVAEDIAGYDKYGSQQLGRTYLLRSLHLLRSAALKVSLFSRLCNGGMDPDSLFLPGESQVPVDEVCLNTEIEHLIGREPPVIKTSKTLLDPRIDLAV